MELKRLVVLQGMIRERLDSFFAEATDADIFYLHEDVWWRLDEAEKCSQEQDLRALKDARECSEGFLRPKGRKEVYFWLDTKQCAIRVVFSKSIKSDAQRRCQVVIDRFKDDADNSYQATHDLLTGLRNRSAFETRVDKAVNSALVATRLSYQSGVSGASASGAVESVFLLALDIDNFKTINDRFGHGYGDLVLAALAWRLESLARPGASSHGLPSGVRMDVYRLGGEEFQILLTGRVSEKDALAVAERVRAAIGTKALPSRDEFETLKRREFYDGAELRPDSQRVVTVSIGVANLVNSSLGKSNKSRASSAVALLKRQADVALYSAKIGGRDRVRNFGDILASYGRISGIDSKAGVVSIDIGREVGVKIGQEFFVYAPNYDGSTDYYMGEGRSRKRVGVYPRLRAARIVAFDVQNEVSFCRVEHLERDVIELDVGSSLEAIPLGSITHLVPTSIDANKFLAKERLFDQLQSTEDCCVIALSLRQLETTSERLGPARTNSILVGLGQHFMDCLSKEHKLAQVAPATMVATIGGTSALDASVLARKIYDQSVVDLPDGVEVGVGWLFKAHGDSAVAGLDQEATAADMIDAAVLASSFSPPDRDGVNAFVSDTLWLSLYSSRLAGQNERMIADYQRFFSVVKPVAWTDNQMALMYVSLNEIERAIEHIEKAQATDPSNEMVVVHRACMLVSVGRYAEAFPIFHSHEVNSDYLDTHLYCALKIDYDAFVALLERNEDRVSDLVKKTAWLTAEEASEVENAVAAWMERRGP